MRILLVLLAALLGANALTQLAAPLWWYDAVPGVPATGAYNPHFVRDIGAAYLVAAVVAGAGFGVAFAGAMRILLERSPEGTQAGTLAAIYLYCYLAAAVANLLAGVAVEVWGLAPVAVGLCGVVVVMVAVGALGSVLRMRR